MRRGFIGGIIAFIVLIIIIVFIAGTVRSEVEKAPQTINSLGIKLGIMPAPYYNVSIISAGRGYVTFTVRDPDPVNGGFVTDFNTITDYQAAEDGISTTVTGVIAYQKLYVATVLGSELSPESNCVSYVGELAGANMEFRDINIGFFPNYNFVNKSLASTIYCASPSITTQGDYWTAVKNATYAPPAGTDKYKAVVIISDGYCDPNMCRDTEEYNQTIKDAFRGLRRHDVNSVKILTSRVSNCANSPILNATATALGIDLTNLINGQMYLSSDGKSSCEGLTGSNYQNIAREFSLLASTISLDFKPLAPEGTGLTHDVAVRVTKKPYTGRGNITVTY